LLAKINKDKVNKTTSFADNKLEIIEAARQRQQTYNTTNKLKASSSPQRDTFQRHCKPTVNSELKMSFPTGSNVRRKY